MFEWKEDYAVGIESIDVQHQGLFELGRKLENIVKNHSEGDNFTEILFAINDLLAYTSDHFDTEEKFMKSINYPKVLEHMEIHEEMVDYIGGIDIMHIDSSQHETMESLIDFIGQWIIEHILETDQEIVRFIEERK